METAIRDRFNLSIVRVVIRVTECVSDGSGGKPTSYQDYYSININDFLHIFLSLFIDEGNFKRQTIPFGKHILHSVLMDFVRMKL